MRVVDLGCGTGELTRLVHERLGAAETLGIDASPAMLARAAAHASDAVRFAEGDIAAFAGDGRWDLVFSNAALHWVPDHPALLARLAAALAPGGQLAFQVPAEQDGPTHVTAAAVAAEEPFRRHLDDATPRLSVLAPAAYAVLLDRLGFGEQHVRLQVYAYRLPARDAVIEWVKGTLLADYRRRLPPELHEPFVARYRERLLPQLEDRRPYLLPFRRILVWGRRAQPTGGS